ncbi:MAG: hypothetical protein ACYC0C_17270 [Devosia sp.]
MARPRTETAAATRPATQLVRQTAPDQPEPRDGVIGALDLAGLPVRNHHPEIPHILRRLPQCRRVDPGEDQRCPVAEELPCCGGALGRRHEALDGGVDDADPLIQRQGDQLVGQESEPVERVGGRTGPGGRLAETARQILCRLFDAGHRDARKFARALQRLDRGDRGPQRLRELRLRIDGLQTGPDHCHAGGGSGGHSDTAGERREPGVRRFHLAAQPSEAARSGFAHAFELGAYLSSAHGREADADAFLGHRRDP